MSLKYGRLISQIASTWSNAFTAFFLQPLRTQLYHAGYLSALKKFILLRSERNRHCTQFTILNRKLSNWIDTWLDLRNSYLKAADEHLRTKRKTASFSAKTLPCRNGTIFGFTTFLLFYGTCKSFLSDWSPEHPFPRVTMWVFSIIVFRLINSCTISIVSVSCVC